MISASGTPGPTFPPQRPPAWGRGGTRAASGSCRGGGVQKPRLPHRDLTQTCCPVSGQQGGPSPAPPPAGPLVTSSLPGAGRGSCEAAGKGPRPLETDLDTPSGVPHSLPAPAPNHVQTHVTPLPHCSCTQHTPHKHPPNAQHEPHRPKHAAHTLGANRAYPFPGSQRVDTSAARRRL